MVVKKKSKVSKKPVAKKVAKKKAPHIDGSRHRATGRRPC